MKKSINGLINQAEEITDKQIKIMTAAVEIFSEKGFSATTTSEVAKKAGVAEGTIFHYFKTKKDLLLAVPDYLSKSTFGEDFTKGITEIFNKPWDRFEDFLRALIQDRREFASGNIKLIKVLFQEIPFHPELRDKLSQIMLSPAMGKFAEAIDNFNQKGQIIDIPSVSVVNLIFSSVFGYFFSRYIAEFKINWDTEKETDYLVRYIMKGICK